MTISKGDPSECYVLLVKRFDREKAQGGYDRARMVSALTLLRADDSDRSRDLWSYILLAEELRRVCEAPQRQVHELFKRMSFNALISNTYDHPRNHTAIAKNKDWKLSPAYDLTPSTPISLEQGDLALTCGDQGRIARPSNLLSQCHRFAGRIQFIWWAFLHNPGLTRSLRLASLADRLLHHRKSAVSPWSGPR